MKISYFKAVSNNQNRYYIIIRKLFIVGGNLPNFDYSLIIEVNNIKSKTHHHPFKVLDNEIGNKMVYFVFNNYKMLPFYILNKFRAYNDE